MKNSSKGSPQWENQIYAFGLQVNNYPYSDLVSYFFNFCEPNKIVEKDKYRVLELGSGAGNNAIFFASLGFDVYCIEGSKTACNISLQKAKTLDVKLTILNDDFSSISFPDDYFDLIIDRAAIYANTIDHIEKTFDSIYRSLKVGG